MNPFREPDRRLRGFAGVKCPRLAEKPNRIEKKKNRIENGLMLKTERFRDKNQVLIDTPPTLKLLFAQG